jgi:uncharacterized protein YecT (DUF1311 family)
MASSGKRNLVEEIQEIKSRSSAGNRIMVSHLIEGMLCELNAINARSTENENDYLLRSMKGIVGEFAIIRSVTIMEVFVRSQIARLIDELEGVALRSDAVLSHVKLSVDIVLALRGKTLSIGDVAGHVVSINKLSDIGGVMSKLLGVDFIDEIKSVHDRWEVEVEKKEKIPIIDNPGRVFSSIERLFEARHILVHELPDRDAHPELLPATWLPDVEKFVRACEWYVGERINPGVPLQQQRMNEYAAGQHQDLMSSVQALEMQFTKLEDRIDDVTRRLFVEAILAWRHHMSADARLWADNARGGSLAPLLAADRASEIARQRLDDLKNLIDHFSYV